MKYFKYIFFCVFFCNAQDLKILSDKDSLPISDVWIVNNDIIISSSDSKGNININKNQYIKDNDTITIHHLNYLDKKFIYTDLVNFKIIYLKEKIFTLNDVSIKNDYKKRKIYPDKSILNSFEIIKSQKPDYNSQVALYVPFKDDYENSYIRKIFITPKNGYWDKDKSLKNLPFTLNLYTLDTLLKLPKDKIFMKNYFVKKGDSDEIEIILDDKIDFPKEGVFVVVEILSREEYKKINNAEGSRPSFKVVGKPSNSKYESYTRSYSTYRKEYSKWQNLKELHINQDYFFGLEIIKY